MAWTSWSATRSSCRPHAARGEVFGFVFQFFNLLPTLTAATARRLRGLRHEVVVNGRHVLVTDEPRDLGGTDTGPTPHELLPASLAACVATMVQIYVARKGWDVAGLVVDVDYHHESEPRQFEVSVHVPEGLSDHQRERIARIAEECPVHRALESGFEFRQRVVIEPAPPEQGEQAA